MGETGGPRWTITQRTAAAIRGSGVQWEGINLFLADGEAAFGEIFHVHRHAFPCFEGDSSKIDANWHHKPSCAELDQIADQINLAYHRLWMSSLSGGT